MNRAFSKPFSVVTDDTTFFVVARVDERTARRCASLVAQGDETLHDLVADALNLRAVAGLLAADVRAGGEA